MKAKVIVFPGSNCDHDCYHVLKNVMNIDVEYAWHKDHSLKDADFVVLPGGFSYGDYLRCGAIAKFSPIVSDLIEYAAEGRPVIGICNGFQVLLEAGLLPGALLRNKTLRFICKDVELIVENHSTIFTKSIGAGKKLRMPIAHGEGNYYCDGDTLKRLRDNGQIVFKYSGGNPNGSLEDIAGIMNEKGNVLGMMPHPERAAEKILGSTDGKLIFESILNSIA